jgi:hypothetical protein
VNKYYLSEKRNTFKVSLTSKNTSKSKDCFLDYFTRENGGKKLTQNYGNWTATSLHLKDVFHQILHLMKLTETLSNECVCTLIKKLKQK